MVSERQSQKRPQTPLKSNSFTRLDASRSNHLPRSRASTLQNGVLAETVTSVKVSPTRQNMSLQQDDIFEKEDLVRGDEGFIQDRKEFSSPDDVPQGFDELPIELVSLIDRFIQSLTAKVHHSPPSIDKLAGMFQDFYVNAESHIATHISALTTRQSRVASPNSPIFSKTSSTTKDGRFMKSSPSKDTLTSLDSIASEQQMLTAQEISERRKARRLLDRKGVALEEAVERRVCERIYHRIWRHRTTLDEVRDEKLRSRTAALALVGIGLQDLGIGFDASQTNVNETDVEAWILKARDGLLKMNDAKYPLGKLQQLAATHKSIVDLLTELHQSSSSADEILPTLIYTLITSPPEGINVISNLQFIQRFRAANRIDGEAAYCLVNLEAAITFLETVDLASLRSDEPLEGPPKSASKPTTPFDEGRPEWTIPKPLSASISTSVIDAGTAALQQPVFDHPLQSLDSEKPSPSVSPSHQRKLSNIFQQPTGALGAAGDAVRLTADQGLKTISNTLDSSFNFLFGRLKEHKVAGDGSDVHGTIIVPKTLDDARRLVDPKDEEEDEINSISAESFPEKPTKQNVSSTRSDDEILNTLAGNRQSRDRSVDSVHSSSSAKKAASTMEIMISPGRAASNSPSKTAHVDSTYSGSAAVESMRSLGNTLNPLKGFGGISVMRGFGRSSAGAPIPTSMPTVPSRHPQEPKDLREVQSLKQMPLEDRESSINIFPPIQRFMEVKTAEELKIGEVSELLRDYKRLASALENSGAF